MKDSPRFLMLKGWFFNGYGFLGGYFFCMVRVPPSSQFRHSFRLSYDFFPLSPFSLPLPSLFLFPFFLSLSLQPLLFLWLS